MAKRQLVSPAFLAAFGREDEPVIVPTRRFVFSDTQEIVAGSEPARLLNLAAHLGCAAEVLGAYDVVEASNAETGRYTETGRQEIANALGRTVIFAPQPSSAPEVDLTRGVTFVPEPAPPTAAA